MGTYSNLTPFGYHGGGYVAEDVPYPWYAMDYGTIPPATMHNGISGDHLYYAFSLAKTQKITSVLLSFTCSPSSTLSGAQVAAYVRSLSDASYISGVKTAKIYSYGNSVSLVFDNMAASESGFYVELSIEEVPGELSTDGSCGFLNPKASVMYAEPSVTGVTPYGSLYTDETASFSWRVNNGTQTRAVIQTSTNGTSWTTRKTISGSATSWEGAAAGTYGSGTVYWHVIVTFDTEDEITSSAIGFDVSERPAPPEPPEPDVPPSITAINVSIKQPAGLNSAFARTYIAGISKCTISVTASPGTYPISSAYFTYPEYSGPVIMTGSNPYSGETPLALPRSTTFTVTVTDSSGWSVSDTVSVVVEPYDKPSITITNLIRCDEHKAEDQSGLYFLLKASASCASVASLNRITSFTAAVKDSGKTPYNLMNYQSQDFLSDPDLINEDAVYIIEVTAQDLVGKTTVLQASLSGKLRDVVFRRDVQHQTAHIGIGMSPAGNTRTTLQLPPDGTIIIGGQDLIAWLEGELGNFPGWNHN